MPDLNATLTERSVGTAHIKVVGVGGGGQNAVNRMFRERVPEVEYISVNTDSQALDSASVPIKLRVGDQTLTAVITCDAADELRLRRGDQATAIIKATEVMVGREVPIEP